MVSVASLTVSHYVERLLPRVRTTASRAPRPSQLASFECLSSNKLAHRVRWALPWRPMSALTCISSRRLSQPSGVSKQLCLEHAAVWRKRIVSTSVREPLGVQSSTDSGVSCAALGQYTTDSRERPLIAAHFASLQLPPRGARHCPVLAPSLGSNLVHVPFTRLSATKRRYQYQSLCGRVNVNPPLWTALRVHRY